MASNSASRTVAARKVILKSLDENKTLRLLEIRTMRNTTAFLILACLLLSGGCYVYVPTEMAAVPPGADVRALLTGDGVEAMRAHFGPEVNSVKGPLVSWDEGGLGLLTELSVSRPGFPPTTLTETSRLLPHHLAGVELRELDGKRTLGFTAAVVGAMAGAILAARAWGGSPDDPNGGDPDPEAAIVFRIPFGIIFR